MMAKKPEDRPASMTELIALLEACKPDISTKPAAADAPKSRPELMVFNEPPAKRPAPQKTDRDPALVPRTTEPEGLATSHDFNLEDLVMYVRSDPPPNAGAPHV